MCEATANKPHQLNLITKEFKECTIDVQFLVKCFDGNRFAIVKATIDDRKVAFAQNLERVHTHIHVYKRKPLTARREEVIVFVIPHGRTRDRRYQSLEQFAFALC